MQHDHALAVLKLDSGATEQAIDRAYRRLALELHPDKGGDHHAFLILYDAREAAL